MATPIFNHQRAIEEYKASLNQLKTSEGMKTFVTEIATMHKVDLRERTINLRLIMPNAEQLVIERPASTEIMIGQFACRECSLVPIRRMIFYTKKMDYCPKTENWVAIAIAEEDASWRWSVDIDCHSGNIGSIDHQVQVELAVIAEEWLDALKAQGWLEKATREITPEEALKWVDDRLKELTSAIKDLKQKGTNETRRWALERSQAVTAALENYQGK